MPSGFHITDCGNLQRIAVSLKSDTIEKTTYNKVRHSMIIAYRAIRSATLITIIHITGNTRFP